MAIQIRAGTSVGAYSTSSVAYINAPSITPTAGDAIFAGATLPAAFSTGAFSDNVNGAYVTDLSRSHATGVGAGVGSFLNSAGGATIVTFTPAASSWIQIGVAAFSGVAISNAYDGGDGGDTYAASVTTASFDWSDADVIIGVFGSAALNDPITSPTDFINIYDYHAGYYPINMCYLIKTGAGSGTLTWSEGTANQLVCIGAPYKPAAGGGLDLSTKRIVLCG